jgi:hypothetical protein
LRQPTRKCTTMIDDDDDEDDDDDDDTMKSDALCGVWEM